MILSPKPLKKMKEIINLTDKEAYIDSIDASCKLVTPSRL